MNNLPSLEQKIQPEQKKYPIGIQVRSQSIHLQVDMENKQINCETKINFGLVFPQIYILFTTSSQVPVDFNEQIELVLYAKQMQIQEISINKQESNIKLQKKLDQDRLPLSLQETLYLSAEAQANACKQYSQLKYPQAYLNMIQLVENVQKETQKIVVRFSFNMNEIQAILGVKQQIITSADRNLLQKIEQNKSLTLQIKYTIKDPIFGLRFIDYERKTMLSDPILERYLITEKQIEASRCWMPVPALHRVVNIENQNDQDDGSQKENLPFAIHYSKIIIAVNQKYFPIASGHLKEVLNNEENKQNYYIYEIEKKCDPDDIGIFIGRFQWINCAIPQTVTNNTLEQPDKDPIKRGQQSILTILSSKNLQQNNIEAYVFGKDFADILGRVERYWFKDPLITKIRDKLELNTLTQTFRGVCLIILPSRVCTHSRRYYTHRSLGPFHQIIITDELYLTDFSEQPCLNKSELLRKQLADQISQMMIKKFLHTSSDQSKDAWVLEALSHLASEESSKAEKYLIEQCEQGSDVILSQRSKFQMASKQFEYKVWTISRMLQRITTSENYVKQVLVQLYKDSKEEGQIMVSSKQLYEATKKAFDAIIKYFFAKYIRSSGAQQFKIQHRYDKNQHKIEFTILQQPLQLRWAQLYTEHRVKAEEKSNILSEISEKYLLIQRNTREMHAQMRHNLNEQNKHTYEQSIKSENNLMRKNQNILQQNLSQIDLERQQQKKEGNKQANALVPLQIKSFIYFGSNVRIKKLETNELELSSEFFTIKVEEKPKCKKEANCKQRIKKHIIPKRHKEINAQAFQQDGGFQQVEQLENDELVKQQMIHGLLGEALMKSGATIQEVTDLSTCIQKDPPLWIKWDPDNWMVKKVESENQEPNTVLCQILKEKDDLIHVSNTMLTIRDNELRSKVLKLVIKVIESSYSYLKSNVIVELVLVLGKLLNQTLLHKKDIQESKDELSEYELYCNMIEKILYRFFFNQNDNSMKYNEYQNSQGDLQIILACIKSLKYLKTTPTIGFESSLMLILITVTEYQDNQFNQYSNKYILAKLLSLIMMTNCQKYKYQALKIILHYLKKETITSSQDHYILYKIVREFYNFVQINFQEQNSIPEIQQVQDLLQLQKLNPISPSITIAFYKQHLEKQFNLLPPYQFILCELVALNQLRVQNASKSFLFKTQLAILTKLVQQNYRKFAVELSNSDIKPEISEALALTIWECLTNGPALIDYEVQFNYASIYRTLYYYWAPLCFVQIIQAYNQKKNQAHLNNLMIGFQIDENWFWAEWNQIRNENTSSKNIYGNVKLHKRQKITPQNQHFDTYQHIHRFVHKKQAKATDKEITKYILKQISGLPQIKDIEEKMRENDLIQQQNSTQMKINYSLKLDNVKMKMKQNFEGMEVTQQYIYDVISSHFEKGYLTDAQRKDLVQLVKNYFQDGAKVIREYQQQSSTIHRQYSNVGLNPAATIVQIQRPKFEDSASKKDLKSQMKLNQSVNNQIKEAPREFNTFDTSILEQDNSDQEQPQSTIISLKFNQQV